MWSAGFLSEPTVEVSAGRESEYALNHHHSVLDGFQGILCCDSRKIRRNSRARFAWGRLPGRLGRSRLGVGAQLPDVYPSRRQQNPYHARAHGRYCFAHQTRSLRSALIQIRPPTYHHRRRRSLPRKSQLRQRSKRCQACHILRGAQATIGELWQAVVAASFRPASAGLIGVSMHPGTIAFARM